jgi:hypothetical protein
MGIEYEYSFYHFNKKEVIAKIKKAKGKKGTYLFRVQVLIHDQLTKYKKIAKKSTKK